MLHDQYLESLCTFPDNVHKICCNDINMLNLLNNKIKTHEQSKVPVMSFDNDQWRIYSAFLSQYRIDLNTASLHYWVFMALLTSLDECAFTRVVDVRQKKIDARWKKENKDALLEAKRRYAINLESEAEEQERQEVINDFLAHAKINRHEEA